MPYWIERSPTSRANCRICDKPIDRDEARIAASFRTIDGSQRQFFHIDCALDHNPDLARRAAASIRRDVVLERAEFDRRVDAAMSAHEARSRARKVDTPVVVADAPEPTTDAMLARLEDDPDDRGALAVLADHLQQRGDPRGELIAVQLAVAAGGSAGELVTRRDALQAELSPPALTAAARPVAVWGIGYVRRLELTAQAALTEIWSHPSLRLLRELSLTFIAAYTEASLAFVATRLPRRLRTLELKHPQPATVVAPLAAAVPGLDTLSVATLIDLRGLTHPTLRRLEISAWAGRDDLGAIAAALDPSALPSLVELVVTATAPFAEVCERLAARGWGARLQLLALRGGSIDSRAAAALATAMGERRLERLDLTGTRCTGEPARIVAAACREVVGEDGTVAFGAGTWIEHTAKPEWGRGKIIGRRDGKLEIQFEHGGVKVFAADARFLRTRG